MGLHEKYGKNVTTYGLLFEHAIGITEPKDVEMILSKGKTSAKSLEYNFLVPWLGTGLLISRDQKWFTRRRIITPTFHFNILEQFIDIFDKESEVLVNKLKKFVGTGDYDIYDDITLCALDSICETSLGVHIDAQNNPDTEYVKAVKEMTLIVFKRVFTLFRQFEWMYDFTELGRRQKKVVKILHDFTNGIIRDRRAQLAKVGGTKKEEPTEDDIYFGKKQRMTFLELLLNATYADGTPLSHEDIREEVDTFTFEGHDTTTSGMNFTIFHLVANQDVQQKVFEELQAVYGKDFETPITYSSLNELKYMEMVIKEALRIHPPVPILGRELMEDTVISGVTVPAGTNVSIPIYALHRDPSVFPDPEKFDPERFTPENTEKRGAYAYIPFSAGPRNCIGQKFAMIEMKTVLMKLLKNFKLLPTSKGQKIILQADLVMKSNNGIMLRLGHRK